MVCKQEVYSWYKNLNVYHRIEVMCGLLNMCSPFELRFFGTCVEDLGKKDFHCLRDAGHKANNVSELTSLTDLNDEAVRSKLVIYLALLDSSNHLCSNVIFKTLTDAEKLANISTSLYDEKIIDEIFLLFTMARHHPAFTFEQKTTISQQLLVMENCFKQTSSEEYKQDTKRKDEPIDSTKLTTGGCTRINNFNSTTQPNKNKKHQASVKSLELKKLSRKKTEKRSDLRIQVLWSNGESTEITKSYQDLCEFNNKIQSLLDEMRTSSNHQDKSIPIITGLRQMNGNKLEENDDHNRISDYLRQLSRKLPQAALESELFTTFFRGHPNPHPQHWSTAVVSVSPYPNQTAATGSSRNAIQQSPNGTSRVSSESAITESGCVKSLTIYNSQIDHSEKKIQETTKGKIPPTVMLNSIGSSSSATHQVIGSSPVISPHPSPVSSPFASPSQFGTNSRAASPWTQRTTSEINMDAQQIFKHDKLQKYGNKFNNYSLDQLRLLSDEDLTKEGLSSSDICTLRKLLESWRTHPPNGLNIHHLGKNNSPVTVPLNPSSVTTPVSTVGMPSPVIHSEVSSVTQVFMVPTTDNQARPMTHPMLPQPMPHNHILPVNAVMSVGGSQNRQLCNAHQSQQRPYYITQHFQPHQSQHYQTPQHHWVLNTENSPSCSEYSSPPGSPVTEVQANNYDSSCSEEMDKDKETDKSLRDSDPVKMKNASNSKQKKPSDNKAACKVNGKARSEEESSSVNSGNFNPPSETNSLTSAHNPGSEMLSQTSPSVHVNSCSGNLANFQRPRMNPASSPSPPGTAVHPAFKHGPQHLTSASPVRNANTIIFENSQLMKPLPAAAVTPSLSNNAHNRWENMNGSCPSVNGPHPQSPNSNIFQFTTTPSATLPNNVSYRTSNTAVSTSVVVTCASRYLPIATTVNMSGMRQITKLVNEDIQQKINGNLNLPLPPATACCMPSAVHGTEPTHGLPNYPSMPNSYHSMSPSTVASTTVTYTTPAITTVNNGQSGSGHSSGSITQGQMSHGLGTMSSITSVCNNGCVCSCSSSTPPGNLAYSPGFLPIHQMNSPAVFPGFPNFLQPHNSNGFISPTMPNYPFPNSHLAAAAAGGLPNGIAAELIYSGTQFPILQQNGSQHSSSGTPGFITGRNVGFHNSYSNPQNPPPVPKMKQHCYNCGVSGHRGLECKEATMEEITKGGQFRLNYTKPMDNPE